MTRANIGDQGLDDSHIPASSFRIDDSSREGEELFRFTNRKSDFGGALKSKKRERYVDKWADNLVGKKKIMKHQMMPEIFQQSIDSVAKKKQAYQSTKFTSASGAFGKRSNANEQDHNGKSSVYSNS